jgi:hypothetical protein
LVPLFGGIKSRKVSFLLPDSTRRLITQPSPDFPLDYIEDTIEEITCLTNGQPYLVQLIGQSLVARFNHRVFEAGEDPDRPISIEDLQAVIHSPEFFQDGGLTLPAFGVRPKIANRQGKPRCSKRYVRTQKHWQILQRVPDFRTNRLKQPWQP